MDQLNKATQEQIQGLMNEHIEVTRDAIRAFKELESVVRSAESKMQEIEAKVVDLQNRFTDLGFDKA